MQPAEFCVIQETHTQGVQMHRQTSLYTQVSSDSTSCSLIPLYVQCTLALGHPVLCTSCRIPHCVDLLRWLGQSCVNGCWECLVCVFLLCTMQARSVYEIISQNQQCWVEGYTHLVFSSVLPACPHIPARNSVLYAGDMEWCS